MKSGKTPMLNWLLRCLKKTERFSPQQDLGRREFIKKAAVGTAVLGGAALLPLGSCQRKDARISIVGAGLAGLTCAYYLKEMGYTAAIYEGDKRIGGRVFSKVGVFAPGMSTEYGAEFINTDHEDMLTLVERFNLELIDTHTDDVERFTFFLEGRRIQEEEIVAAFESAAAQIAKDREACGELFDTDRAHELDALSLDKYLRTLSLPDWLEQLIENAYVAEYGLDARDQSALNLLWMIQLENGEFSLLGDSDERYKVVGGNEEIVKKLSESLAGQITLEKKLKKVSYKGKVIRLSFEDGTEVESDVAVLAIPISILRTLEWEVPLLSEEKMACIQEMGFGVNNKLMLALKDRPWRNAKVPNAGYLVHSSELNAWDNGHMQNENKGATGFTIFLGGKRSLAIAEVAAQSGDRERIPLAHADARAEILDQVFPGFKSAYNGNNYAAFWSSNPFSRGSYTCFKPGQALRFSALLAEPCGHLFFAGEHCSEDYSGYMNGAAESGRFAAEGIRQLLNS